MEVLFFSDFHNAVDLEQLKQALSHSPAPDLAFTLGDISVSDLIAIKEIIALTPLYGVLGNHDSADALDLAGIPNIHGKAITIAGVRFAGFEGSVRYKPGRHPAFTQRESLEVAKTLPAADILISHDRAFHGKPPSLFRKYSKDPHEGLAGIAAYLHRNSPFLHVHGHIHENKEYNKHRTDTISVFGATAITIRANRVESHRSLLPTPIK